MRSLSHRNPFLIQPHSHAMNTYILTAVFSLIAGVVLTRLFYNEAISKGNAAIAELKARLSGIESSIGKKL